ncbi:uncharacterized protein [Chelonus insularis]|uniref:uncharacterized protein n=1 Tax=Chelonus insularis TaxID=460826 RepID=UPI00158CCB19|nr:uncharacterized protein LOC118072901 [Chelonus insularis]
MACLETKPQLYSKWCNKTLKDKFNTNSNELERNSMMNSNISSPPVDHVDLQEINDKILSLKNLLQQDLRAADLRWSFFVAACNTYKHNNCLKPFPPMYITNGIKDIEALRETIEVIPPLAIINERLEDPNFYDNHKATINLLHWVLIGLRDPFMKSVNKDTYESIINKVPSELVAAKPNLIFELVSPNQSAKEDRWNAVSKGYSTFFAYHGSRLENFHSILHYGIQQSMSKNGGIFGNGIYLSSELEVSLHWSPAGYGWGGSVIGSDISCVALCELVDHPDVKRGNSGNSGDTLQVALGNKVPIKYYLVQNSDLVRVRYLLVYSRDTSTTKHTEVNGVIKWFKQNKFLTLLLGYFSTLNQENVKNTKSAVNAISGQTRRAALGEIGNRVPARGIEVTKNGVLQPKVLKKPQVKQLAQSKQPLTAKTEKLPVQIVKPVLKVEVKEEVAPAEIKEEVKQDIKDARQEIIENELKPKNDAFSSDLLQVEDVDEADKDNPLLVTIYSNDIYRYLMELEAKYPIKKGYLTGQEVTYKMRSVLIDWLVEVHQQFRLLQETLYLTVAIIDRFLQSFTTITRKKLQLVGVAAMFIACKYEEMYAPDISDFVFITDNAYNKNEILQMEMLIVRTLNYSFGRPLPLHFLRRYSKVARASSIHHTMAKYFMEQCLVHYEMCHHPPSLIAAAAIYFAFYVIGNDDSEVGKPIWTHTLAHYSTYSKDQVLPVVRDIAAIIINADKDKYQAVRKKYVQAKHMKISLRPELKSPSIISLANIDNH